MAWRTVIRATPNCCTSSRSEGAGAPGSAPRDEGADVLAHLDVLEGAASRGVEHVVPRSRTIGRWSVGVTTSWTHGPLGLCPRGTLLAPRHSVAIARSTSRRAARRAGNTAASTPMTTESSQEDGQLGPRQADHLEPLVAQGVHQRDPEARCPAPRPSTAPRTAITTDSRVIISRSWRAAQPDRAQQPDLAGALDHREREGVDDAEHGDHQGQAEQREDHQHELVDRRPLLVGERRLVLDRDDRQVRDHRVEAAPGGRRSSGLGVEDQRVVRGREALLASGSPGW